MKYLLSLLLLVLVPAVTSVAAQQPATTGQVVIDRHEMEQVLNAFLTRQSKQLPQVQLRFKSIDYPDPYEVPQGRIEHQLIPSNPGVIGSRRITLLTRVDGEIYSNKSLRVDLEAMAKVAVAASALRRGSILEAKDVELRLQDISRLDEPIFSVADVVGRELKRSIRLGEALEQQQIEFPPVVKRGERVVIRAQGPGLTLSAAGEAKQDGRTGEMIRVVNSNSHKEVLCQVVAPGLVKVEF